MDNSHVKAEIVSDYILLAASEKYRLWFKNGRLYSSRGERDSYELVDDLSGFCRGGGLMRWRVFQRVLRLVPRCGIFIDEDTALISFHGSILNVNIPDKTVTVEHSFRSGMNNPLTFAKIENIRGFDDGILYGEYFGNENQEAVSIYKRQKEGNWTAAYTFPPRAITHIHNLILDPEQGCLYVLTGDRDQESGIWKITDNFHAVSKVLVGNQQYRSCVGYPFRGGFFFVTDTPLETNHLYFMANLTEELQSMTETEGPCIYGAQTAKDIFAFSTSVEPDARLKGWRYKLSYRRGQGVKSRYSKVYCGNPETGFHEVLSGRKDILPMLAAGFGTFLFPNCAAGQDGSFFVTGQSIRKYDGKTIKVSIDLT